MRFSLKSDYALRAALDLALHSSATRLVRTADIALRTGAPAKFLEAVLGQLRRAGIAHSERGSRGGHRLARAPGRVRAGDGIRAVEGPDGLSVRPGGKGPTDAAGGAAARALHHLWTDADGAVAASLDGITLEDLVRRVQQASGGTDYAI